MGFQAGKGRACSSTEATPTLGSSSRVFWDWKSRNDSQIGEVTNSSDQAECWGGCSIPNTAPSIPKGVTLQAGCPSSPSSRPWVHPEHPTNPRSAWAWQEHPKALSGRAKGRTNPSFCVTPVLAQGGPHGQDM